MSSFKLRQNQPNKFYAIVYELTMFPIKINMKKKMKREITHLTSFLPSSSLGDVAKGCLLILMAPILLSQQNTTLDSPDIRHCPLTLHAYTANLKWVLNVNAAFYRFIQRSCRTCKNRILKREPRS